MDWKFLKYITVVGYILHVNPEKREIVVFIPNDEVTFIADVSSYVDIKKLRTNRVYDLSFAVYACEANTYAKKIIIRELRSSYLNEENRYRREYNLMKLKKVEDFIQHTKYFFRFELRRATNPVYSTLLQEKFEQLVLKSYHANNTKFRWRHFLCL